MRDIMPWEQCTREFVREVSVDPERTVSIIETALRRKEYIDERDVTVDTVSFVVEGLYEVIKELLVALLLKDGLKSSNHQCLISYFNKKFPEYEFEVSLISRMCFLRNRLNYYGDRIDIAFYEKNKEHIRKVIDLLLRLVRKQ